MGKLRQQLEDALRDVLPKKDLEDLLVLIDTFDRRDELFQTLQTDAQMANEALRKDYSDQYTRRTFIRTNFAMTEGLLNVLTDTVLEMHKAGLVSLTNDELEKLTERRVTKKGETRPRFLSLEAKVQFSFLIFAQKIGGYDYRFDTSTNEWKEFEAAIEVRNQLMHPRTIMDMTINQQQLNKSRKVIRYCR